MKFDDFDTIMRRFETEYDACVPEDRFIIARLDGRTFTRLTKERHPFECPFDSAFRDLMVETARHLMTCGFGIAYAYTQSDEMSLLFEQNERTFARKLRKLNSTLAGEASAKFSLMLQAHATFDCRISQLPDVDRVVDYFRWRREDARRNALGAHCHWALIAEGNSPRGAAKMLRGLSTREKRELLDEKLGKNFDDLPRWQTAGSGLYWREAEKSALNPKTGEHVTATRRRIVLDMELPDSDSYGEFVREKLGAVQLGLG